MDELGGFSRAGREAHVETHAGIIFVNGAAQSKIDRNMTSLTAAQLSTKCIQTGISKQVFYRYESSATLALTFGAIGKVDELRGSAEHAAMNSLMRLFV